MQQFLREYYQWPKEFISGPAAHAAVQRRWRPRRRSRCLIKYVFSIFWAAGASLQLDHVMADVNNSVDLHLFSAALKRCRDLCRRLRLRIWILGFWQSTPSSHHPGRRVGKASANEQEVNDRPCVDPEWTYWGWIHGRLSRRMMMLWIIIRFRFARLDVACVIRFVFMFTRGWTPLNPLLLKCDS